jgi:predicted RND superfamily exporter protein
MDWITVDMLRTVGGAAGVVALVMVVLKAIFPSITGRLTQLLALVVSLVIAVVIGDWASPVTVLTSLLNGLVICVASMGIDQAVNYNK